jgi:hypothetical protein
MVFAYRLIAVDLLRIVYVRTRIVNVSSFAAGLARAAVRRPVFAPAVSVLTAVATPGVGAGTAAFDNGYDFLRGVYTCEAAGKAAVRADIFAGFVACTPAIPVGIARRARSRP